MGVTTIDPRSPLAAALQAQLARVGGRARAQAPAKAAGASQTARAGSSLAARVGAIGPHDPDRRRKAVRIYLESELAREFGAGLLIDPSLAQLLDAVQQHMQEDSETAAAVEALGELLLAGRAG